MTTELSQEINWKGGGWMPEVGKTYYVLMTNCHIYTVKLEKRNAGFVNPDLPDVKKDISLNIDSIADLSKLKGENIKFWAELPDTTDENE